MKELSLSGLAAEFRSMAEHLDVEPYYKAFHTSPQHDGAPHVEMRSGKFEFVVTEHGSELERISGLDNDEVLYLLFEGITSIVATSNALRNRKPTGDSRAAWFPYQEKLMAGLRPSWGIRLKREHEENPAEVPTQPITLVFGGGRRRDGAGKCQQDDRRTPLHNPPRLYRHRCLYANHHAPALVTHQSI